MRRFTERPWTWAIVAVVAIGAVFLGLDWLDTIDFRTAGRESWAARIVIVGALGLFVVEVARRLRWWLGVGALIALIGFVVVGLGVVVDEIRTDEFSDSDRRETAAGPPLAAEIVEAPTAAGVDSPEEWAALEPSLEPVLTGLTQPVAVEAIPGADRYVVLQREGEIRVIGEGENTGTTLVDLSDETTLDGERGMFDIAISPADGRLYVSFSDLEGDNRVISFSMADDATLSDRQEIIEVTQPFNRHNGGALEFDAHGYLLLGVGDGGRLRDSLGAGQDRTNRLATLLRIAPLPDGGYEIPPDNPYLDEDGVWPEIYAYGLRNPWRLSTDSVTGDIWIGDVGQDAFEEVNRVPYDNAEGSNFGWSITEGDSVHVGKPDDPTGYTEADIPDNYVDPVFFYQHDLEATEGARNSITGGYVYRASAIPVLQGTYVYADFSASVIGAVLVHDGVAVEARDLLGDVPAVVSFGVDHEGEILVVSLAGEISRLVA